jgi:hypothetical protein
MRLTLFLISLILVSCGASESKKPGYRVKWIKYRATSEEEAKIQISLWDQKAWLLNGKGEVVLETDVATGVAGKESPQGVFEVLERIESKRSNLYGKYVNEATGEVVIEKAWEHSGEVPAVMRGLQCPIGCGSPGVAWACMLVSLRRGSGVALGASESTKRHNF